LPESFNVMMKELMALGLDVELVEEKSGEDVSEEEGDQTSDVTPAANS